MIRSHFPGQKPPDQPQPHYAWKDEHMTKSTLGFVLAVAMLAGCSVIVEPLIRDAKENKMVYMEPLGIEGHHTYFHLTAQGWSRSRLSWRWLVSEGKIRVSELHI